MLLALFQGFSFFSVKVKVLHMFLSHVWNYCQKLGRKYWVQAEALAGLSHLTKKRKISTSKFLEMVEFREKMEENKFSKAPNRPTITPHSNHRIVDHPKSQIAAIYFPSCNFCCNRRKQQSIFLPSMYIVYATFEMCVHGISCK